MTEHLKSIALGARSASRLFIAAVTRELRARHDCEIHLYCGNAQEVKYYEGLKDGAYTTINIAAQPMVKAFDAGLDEEDVFRRAHEFEELTGMTMNRMIVPDRHMGRGYSLGGFYHPRSRYSEEVDYLHAVHAYCATLEYWRQEFTDKNITLVIDGAREAAYIARSMGIPYRALVGSRYKNYHYWAWNELYENPMFASAFEDMEERPDIELTKPYHAHLAARPTYHKTFRLSHMLKSCAMLVARQVYWRIRGYQKAKGYYLSENLKFTYRVWREYRRLMKMRLWTLEELKGKRFAYFPMHIEPETALHGISPEYFYQQSLIAAVSRDLPADVVLAVKEPYGMIGRRPDHFYQQIADLKNVILLNPWEVGLQCAQTADVVVTICGTAGLEAIAAGTPVIAFGRHNLYNFLPSVQVVQEELKLKEYLARALNGDLDRNDIQSQAKRLIGSVLSCSFDMGEYDYIKLDRFDDDAVKEATSALADSLRAHKLHAGAALV